MSSDDDKVTEIWITGSGEEIRICDMTDRHLINAIHCAQRMHREAQLAPEPMLNGDMAQFYAENEWEALMANGPEYTCEQYPYLCMEADRRGLKYDEF